MSENMILLTRGEEWDSRICLLLFSTVGQGWGWERPSLGQLTGHNPGSYSESLF